MTTESTTLLHPQLHQTWQYLRKDREQVRSEEKNSFDNCECREVGRAEGRRDREEGEREKGRRGERGERGERGQKRKLEMRKGKLRVETGPKLLPIIDSCPVV